MFYCFNTDQMKKNLYRLLAIALLLYALPFNSPAQNSVRASWIGAASEDNTANTWLAFRKTLNIRNKPAKLNTRIAADSKYWLWINDKLVIFEGGLKRGPNPDDTYADEIDIASYLKTGQNTIAVLLWYFGKEGFSHKSSGKAGLFLEAKAMTGLNSNKTWKCMKLDAYQTAGEPQPNYRLPESSILYNAEKDIGFWQGASYDDRHIPAAAELGTEGSAPWNKLVKRPIPFFKNSGLRNYIRAPKLPLTGTGDTLVCELPYNAQITPYFEIEAEPGQKISMFTDNYLLFLKGEKNLRAEYLTRKGRQSYESYGWINGHKIYYVIPKGVRVLELKYRETGYDAAFSGSFTSDNTFLNRLWQKAQRTLYLNMRDSYMDCPERERAQWTGDAVNESGQAFYALSPSSHALSRKWLHELTAWQKKDSSLFAPSPAGNWDKELPDQSIASIGYYGLWNYYLHSGDKQTLADVYDSARRYLLVWKLNDKGTIIFRPGGWTWGDWGDNRDMLLLYNLWYYLGLKGMQLTAAELGKTEDAAQYKQLMTRFKIAFNQQFWTGSAYRDPAYKDLTDDRVQALAILSGIAGKEKYSALLRIFQQEEHASPYMEKYVFEAMFMMGYEKEALARQEKRFAPMVNNNRFTTLFEVWNVHEDGTGDGTINHAWSGGGLTVLGQYLSGIAPTKPGYKQFRIKPQPGPVSSFTTTVPSVAGDIHLTWNRDSTKGSVLKTSIPAGTEALVNMPEGNYQQITLNNKVIWSKASSSGPPPEFTLKAGSWVLKGT